MLNYIINRWYFQKTVKTILVPETLLPLEIVSEFCTPYLQKKICLSISSSASGVSGKLLGCNEQQIFVTNKKLLLFYM